MTNGKIAFAAAAMMSAAALAAGLAALSFAAAAVAVVLPQAAMLILARRCPPQSAFSLWAGKFCCTILLLALAARGLHFGGILAAEYFVGGAMAGLIWNIARAAKTETA